MKVILFDIDGVVIIRHEYFSERYSQEYGVPLEKITPFFKNEFPLCVVGKADLREEIPKYLNEWGWSDSLEEFLKYWFESEKQTDPRVLEVVKKFRECKIKCFLVSDNEKYRADYLMDSVKLKNLVDGSFLSCELGVKKTQREFFEKVLKILSVTADDVMYWDDDLKNVEIAKELGIDARFYSGSDELEKAVSLLCKYAGKF